MKNNIYTVSQINNYIKLVLEDDVLLNPIYIEGEISNFKKHTSGHIYFTLKDEDCSINCIIYKQDAQTLPQDLENGLKIICCGNVSSYVKTGQYQFCIKSVKNSGTGNVFLDFEKLKEKLQKEGLFDKVYKMEIPKLPQNVGVITSQTGAAIRDIINVSKRRNPNVNIIVIPTLVQGKYAPQSIIDAITLANEYKKLDVIVLARGGGSKEDLWAFNDEDVARAIFYSSIPIVTGIGHEIDFTIADFVADFRAPTPSAAIEVCLPEIVTLKERLQTIVNNIQKNMLIKIEENNLKFQLNINKSCFINFRKKILDYEKQTQINFDKINNNIKSKINKSKLLLDNNINKIDAMSPINILKNGYALVCDENNKNIKSSKNVKKDDIVKINFYDGEKKAKIIE